MPFDLSLQPNQPRLRPALAIQGPAGLLLVKHQKESRSYWLLPGGGVNYGESVAAALRREVLEETGLVVDLGDFLFASESIAPDKSRHGVHLVFRGTMLSGTLKVNEEPLLQGRGRLTGAQWFSLERLPALDLHPPYQQELLLHLQRPSPHLSGFVENRWVD